MTVIIKIIKNVLGTYFNQPLHTTLRQFKIVPVGLIFSSQLILWEIVKRLESMDTDQASVALGAIAAALIASIWKGLETTQAKHEKDDE